MVSYNPLPGHYPKLRVMKDNDYMYSMYSCCLLSLLGDVFSQIDYTHLNAMISSMKCNFLYFI